jgi:predicted molibdopterin-dependent oxidoreductase YjgC
MSLRAIGTNGFQEPAVEFKDGKIIGSKRLYADGKFGTKDGKAVFMETAWRGLQAPGKEAEKNKWPFLINNGRTNHVWQSAYLDQQNDFVTDRWPYPFIEMNPDDMAELKINSGDLLEVYNDNGSTQAVAYPTAKADLHAVRISDRRARQRRVGRRERVHHPELQADLGRDPKDCRSAGRLEASDFQVAGIRHRITSSERARSSCGSALPR